MNWAKKLTRGCVKKSAQDSFDVNLNEVCSHETRDCQYAHQQPSSSRGVQDGCCNGECSVCQVYASVRTTTSKKQVNLLVAVDVTLRPENNVT